MKNDRRSSQKAQRSQYCKRVIHIRLEIPPANCVPQGFQMTIHLLLRNFLGISVLAVLTKPGLTIGDATTELGFMIIRGNERIQNTTTTTTHNNNGGLERVLN